MNSNQPDRETEPVDQLSAAESAALDALIDEVVSGKTPPNFGDSILKRLHVQTSATESDNTLIHAAGSPGLDVQIRSVSRSDHRAARRRRRRSRWIAAAGLATAASLIAFLWKPAVLNSVLENLAVQNPNADSSIALSNAMPAGVKEPLVAPEPAVDAGIAATRADSESVASSDDTDSGPMVAVMESESLDTASKDLVAGLQTTDNARVILDSIADANADAAEDMRSLLDTDGLPGVDRSRDHLLQRPPLPVKLVSKRIDRDLQNYWNSAGVEPTPNAGVQDVVDRLSTALGVAVPPSVLENHQSVSAWLSDRKVSTAIAETWLQQVTGGGLFNVPPKMQNRLKWGVAHRFRNTSSFDVHLISLLRGNNELSSAFYTAMLAGDHLPNATADATDPDLVANLAALTMNTDVSCTRCHDSMVGHGHGMEDYWGFAAVLSGGLKPSGAKLERAETESLKAAFYEDKDRKGRMAQPAISPRWIAADAANSSPAEPQETAKLQSISAWSLALRGSRPLAGGIVNSLWKLVHGRPLRGAVAHPMTAPMSDELLKLENDLAEDLIRSGFDINRTLSMILMSPTTRRSVSGSLRDVWATDHSEAHRKAVVFAGSLPVTKPIAMSVKVRQSMLAIGGLRISTGDQLLGQLAQPDSLNAPGARKAAVKKPDASKTLPWDFPDSADAMPVPWLGSVKGLETKIRHLCFLAGHDKVPRAVTRAAGMMEKAGVDEATLLHRVWWIAQGR